MKNCKGFEISTEMLEYNNSQFSISLKVLPTTTFFEMKEGDFFAKGN